MKSSVLTIAVLLFFLTFSGAGAQVGYGSIQGLEITPLDVPISQATRDSVAYALSRFLRTPWNGDLKACRIIDRSCRRLNAADSTEVFALWSARSYPLILDTWWTPKRFYDFDVWVTIRNPAVRGFVLRSADSSNVDTTPLSFEFPDLDSLLGQTGEKISCASSSPKSTLPKILPETVGLSKECHETIVGRFGVYQYTSALKDSTGNLTLRSEATPAWLIASPGCPSARPSRTYTMFNDSLMSIMYYGLLDRHIGRIDLH